MTPCCPNCSAQSIGIEAASMCTECASATVAGATFSIPALIAGVVVATLAVFVVRRLARVANAARHPLSTLSTT